VKIGENAVFGEEKGQKLGSNGICAACKIMCYMAWISTTIDENPPRSTKKEAIFQSLRCLGEKIRTSGLLNPIQKISFAFYAVFCLYFRISPDKCDDILNNHPYKGKLDHVLTTHINF
jgi:hypothetical protein